MQRSPWWDVAVVGVCAVLAGMLVLTGAAPWRLNAGLAVLAALLVAWFAIGRQGWEHPRASVAFRIVLVLLVGVAVSIYPVLAVAQVIGYPLVWVLSGSFRSAVVGNIALALAVGGGFLVALGTGPDAVTEAAVTVVISLGFSLAMGAWINSIERLSEQRQELIDRLGIAQAEVAALSREAGVTSERERLARELHDTIAQSLTALVMLTQHARRDLAEGALDAAGSRLEQLEASARETLVEARSLIAATAPVELDTGGLGPALTRLVDRFSRETGIEVSLHSVGDATLTREVEVVLLRCTQEALANVRKHSRASRAAVTLETAGGATAAKLTVTDDGAGFDPSAPKRGFGLAGMRDRLALVGGRLEVDSGPRGTTLTVAVPLAVSA